MDVATETIPPVKVTLVTLPIPAGADDKMPLLFYFYNIVSICGPIMVLVFITGGLVGDSERPPGIFEGWDT